MLANDKKHATMQLKRVPGQMEAWSDEKKITKTRNVIGGNALRKWNWLKHWLQWHSLSYDSFTNATTRAGLISVLRSCGQTHLPMCLCVGGRMLLIAVTSGTIFYISLTKVQCEGQQWSNAFTLSSSKFLCSQSITVQMSPSSGTTTARLQVRTWGLRVVGSMAVNKKWIFFFSKQLKYKAVSSSISKCRQA